MPQLIADPPLPPSSNDEPFLQTIRLLDGKTPLVTARWHTCPPAADGVIQILDLTVSPAHRRQGHGSAMLKEMLRLSAEYFRSRRVRFRRAWMAIHQKQHITARAFFTAHGFHHVSTVQNLLKGEDLLIYQRSLD